MQGGVLSSKADRKPSICMSWPLPRQKPPSLDLELLERLPLRSTHTGEQLSKECPSQCVSSGTTWSLSSRQTAPYAQSTSKHWSQQKMPSFPSCVWHVAAGSTAVNDLERPIVIVLVLRALLSSNRSPSNNASSGGRTMRPYHGLASLSDSANDNECGAGLALPRYLEESPARISTALSTSHLNSCDAPPGSVICSDPPSPATIATRTPSSTCASSASPFEGP
mmetsp:Transcript_5058/g.14323  ORF Transcript_5058/g.14323 Transcript_5058/m.14323 type:complete len:223 (-) Transcript_5058:646-1314(-)